MSSSVDEIYAQALGDFGAGRFEEAIAGFVQTVRLKSDHAGAWHNLGLLCYRQGDTIHARTALETAVNLRPDYPDSLTALSAVLGEEGEILGAVEAAVRAVALAPGRPDLRNAEGRARFVAGEVDAAEAAFRQALEHDNGYRPALANLARLLLDTDRSAEAEALLDDLPDALSGEPTLLLLRAEASAGLGRIDNALSLLRSLPADDARAPDAACCAADLLMGRREYAAAIEACWLALQNHPYNIALLLKVAQCHWDDGQPEEAERALRDVLRLDRDNVTALYNLSLRTDLKEHKPVISRLRSLIATDTLSSEDETRAWYGLGNHHAALGEWEAALACFSKGKACHHEVSDPFLKEAEACLARPLPKIQKRAPVSGPAPLFIVGASRSGKSLVQNVLAASAHMVAADEVGLHAVLGDDPKEDGERLEAALGLYGAEGQWVIDTHPDAVLYLDRLLAAHPGARAVLCHREPLDAAVSIYARLYVNRQAWSCTWPSIAARLRAVESLLDHWGSVFGAGVFALAYENFIAEPEALIRELCAALDVPWDEAVAAAPAKAGGPQVLPWASIPHQRVLSLNATGLWRPFAPWLTAFAEAYGHDRLADNGAIPAMQRQPVSEFVIALAGLSKARSDREGGNLDKAESELAGAASHSEDVPALAFEAAEIARMRGHYSAAVSHLWRACSMRPFTRHIRTYSDELTTALALSPGHDDAAALHADVADLWAAYRRETPVPFGDYGVYYQSCQAAYLPGSRDTEERIAAYGLTGDIRGRNVLDLGCNTGFLSLALAQDAAYVTGIEKAPALIAIAQRVAMYCGVPNCHFMAGDAGTFQAETPFDVVIAAAVHGWLDLPIGVLATKLFRLTAPDGILFLESQGRRSTVCTEPDFEDKVKAIMDVGFAAERGGEVCDDRVNLRRFVILRRRG